MSSKAKQSGARTVLWWVAWITLTIVSFFIASAIWTPLIAKHFGSIHNSRTAIIWVTAVFGTWLVILFPLIIVMYSKVDKAYEDARIRREKAAQRFRSIDVPRSERVLDFGLTKKMQGWPETIAGGHLVNLTLKDGRRIANVFVSKREEILGIYDAKSLEFSGRDVRDVEAVDMKENPPQFFQTNWLRLDGATLPE